MTDAFSPLHLDFLPSGVGDWARPVPPVVSSSLHSPGEQACIGVVGLLESPHSSLKAHQWNSRQLIIPQQVLRNSSV